jgi:L-amino acid N-acyltransferase YncA
VSHPVAIRPAEPADAGAIAAIYDEGIAGGSATFATGPHTAEERRGWLAARGPRAPVVVAARGAEVVGWGAVAPFSHRPWYHGVGEYTAYVAGRARGAGVGGALVAHLVEIAPALGYWKLVGLIFPENGPGLALATAAGFSVVGTHRAHARMEGEWRDVTLVERHLEPVPGG